MNGALYPDDFAEEPVAGITEDEVEDFLATPMSDDRSRAVLRGAKLKNTNLRCAVLTDADLTGADLRCANLRGADLTGVGLRCANLSGADLRDADLMGADLKFADLTDADLTGATYDPDTVWPDGFDPKAAGAVEVDR